MRLPQWGMGMQEGEIVTWFKREGEDVQKGDPLVEVEAAKVTDTVVAPSTGRLIRIIAAEGQTVQVREVLAIIAAEDEAV